MIEAESEAFLVLDAELKKWSHHGYTESHELPSKNKTVTVLTPYSIVQLYRNGLKPQVHHSVAG